MSIYIYVYNSVNIVALLRSPILAISDPQKNSPYQSLLLFSTVQPDITLFILPFLLTVFILFLLPSVFFVNILRGILHIYIPTYLSISVIYLVLLAAVIRHEEKKEMQREEKTVSIRDIPEEEIE
jgi:hypothetical protein